MLVYGKNRKLVLWSVVDQRKISSIKLDSKILSICANPENEQMLYIGTIKKVIYLDMKKAYLQESKFEEDKFRSFLKNHSTYGNVI